MLLLILITELRHFKIMRTLFLYLCLLFSVTSCASYTNYYKLDKNYLQNRQISTKDFKVNDEELVLKSSIQVLQDLGFNIDESEKNLGIITASKNKEINSTVRVVNVFVLMAFSETNTTYDIRQKIYVTVSTKKNSDNFVSVKVTFARKIWNNLEQFRVEKIYNKDIHKSFFDKLEQSLFLVKNNI